MSASNTDVNSISSITRHNVVKDLHEIENDIEKPGFGRIFSNATASGSGVGGGCVEMSPDCFQMISFVDSFIVVCGGVWEEEWEEG